MTGDVCMPMFESFTLWQLFELCRLGREYYNLQSSQYQNYEFSVNRAHTILIIEHVSLVLKDASRVDR